MSGQPAEQPSQASHGDDGTSGEAVQQQDVWAELFGIVHGLSESVGVALQALTPSDEKAVSAITKKRLALRSIHGLKQSQNGIETLLEHLKALQAASQTWQRSMMYASKSHQELMEQIESTTDELHKTNERLRAIEAQRLAAVREAELLRARAEQQEAAIKEAQSSLTHKENELETLQFSVHELQSSSSQAQQSLDRARQVAAEADERARAATTALDDAKAEASKAQGLAERHQQVVAKLTADNLVFLMQLKKTEADLAVANQERAQLRLAAEQQRGPWFDQVRAGVEERVRQSMQRSQELEACLERQGAEHGAQMEAMQAQQSRLEEQLRAARQDAAELQERMESAVKSKEWAEGLAASADAAAREARRELDNLAAENRVLQESLRSMRQECTERWVNEQAAVGRVNGLEQRIEELQQQLSQQATQLAALQRQLDTQLGINRQLMARKEEVEWQLMAAMAKIDGGAADQPVPLNLRVSGLLQVGGPNQQERNGEDAAASASSGPGRIAAADFAKGATARSHTTCRTASAGGAETRPAATPAAGLLGDSAALPQQYAPQPRSLPTYAAPVTQWHASGDEASPSRVARPNLASNSYTSDSAQRASAAVGASSGGGGSPSRVTRLDTGASPQGRVQSLLMPEASLLVAHDDLATITHVPGGGTRGLCDDDTGAGGGAVAGGLGSGMPSLDAPGRVTSVEGASTVVSSPPSSVALSTDPGSPSGALSHTPSDIVISREVFPARVAAVTIRTVSTGHWRPGAGADGAQPPSGRGGPPATVAAAGGAGGLATGLGQQHQQVLERRGSLHDGEDVWLAGVASSSSSDDSDFLFAGGITIQRESHVDEPRNLQMPAQQAQLFQLQQRLQVHLQGPSATNPGAEAGGALRQWAGQDLNPRCGSSPKRQIVASGWPTEAPARAPHAYHHHHREDSDDDVIRVRAPLQRGADGSGVVIRTAIPVRSVRVLRDSFGSDASGAKPSAASTEGQHARGDRTDPGVGVFSIVKGGAPPEAAARSGSSPMHPALAGRLGGTAPHATGAGSPNPASPSGAAGPAAPAAAAVGSPSQGRMVHQTGHTAAAALADAAQPFPRGSAGGAPADTDPIPSRVQLGPPFFATGGPLDSSAVAVLQRWTLSVGGGGDSAPRGPAQAHYPQQQLLPETTVPLSPARSTASMRSPRSPPHPAIPPAADRNASAASSNPGAALGGAPSGLGGSAGGAAVKPGSQEAVAAEAVPVSAAARTGAQASTSSRLQGQVVSTSTRDGGAAADAAVGLPTRHRVSFHGLAAQGGQAAAGGPDDSGSAGAGTSHLSDHVRMSFILSSSLALQGAVNGSGTQQPHKPSSVKSVRFSDHDPVWEEEAPRRRESLEYAGTGIAARASLRTAAGHMFSQDAVGRFQPSRLSVDMEPTGDRHTAEQRLVRGAGVKESPQKYRSRGPVQHPAMLGVSAAATTVALDAAEAMPSKRYSAAGVATTAAPRAPAGSE